MSQNSKNGQGRGQSKQSGGAQQGAPFKSRMCKFFESGQCRQGSTCNFAHSADELSKPRRGNAGGGGSREGRREQGGGGGGGGNRGNKFGNNNNGGSNNSNYQDREAFVLPERPPVVLPNLNEGKTSEEIEASKQSEAVRLKKQKEFVEKFLDEIKYDESIMHEGQD